MNTSGSKEVRDINLSGKALKIWIGRSPRIPMTEFSGGYGPKFYGNSILFQIGKNKYMFVGSEIFTFSLPSAVTQFSSPVGGSDVPYPWIRISTGWYYLMLEKVCFKSPKVQNPYYDVYWRDEYRPPPHENMKVTYIS